MMTSNNNNVLITGGAGFIGSRLANVLTDKGYKVTVLDNLLSQVHGNDPAKTSFTFKSLSKEVHFIHGSVTNKKDVQQALSGKNIIVHLAAETGTGQSMYAVERYVNTNILGTALLLEIIANTKTCVNKFVVASSRAIYGEGKYFSTKYGTVYPEHRNKEDMLKGNFEVQYKDSELLECMPTDEESKIHPSSIYGITKQNQEQMVMTVCKSVGVKCAALRYQNVYGPGQSLNNPYTGILSIFSTLIRNNKPINIFEDGKESRDFVFIDDVVSATIKSIESDKANDEIFNVGNGKAIDVLTVATTLCKHYNTEVPLNISGNFRIGDIRHNYACLNKIEKLLQYKPAFSFDKGIQQFTDWVLTQEILEMGLESSLTEMKERGLFN